MIHGRRGGRSGRHPEPPKAAREPPRGWISIGELASRAGVTRATVHHYVALGLLPEPVKTNRRMAFYDPAWAERVRFIKELQEKRFLPLREIGRLLRESSPAELRRTDRSLLERDERGARYTRDQLLERHGVDAADLDRMIAIGLLAPRDGLFSSEDERIVFCVSEMRAAGLNAELGFDLDELHLYVELCDRLIDAEFSLFNPRVLGRRRPEEAARLARVGMLLSSKILGALHYRKILRRMEAMDRGPAPPPRSRRRSRPRARSSPAVTEPGSQEPRTRVRQRAGRRGRSGGPGPRRRPS